MRTFIVLILTAISICYLLNIGIGFIEIIPDNFPFVGNLDEAGATALLLMCLRYFGVDISGVFARTNGHDSDAHVIEV